MKRILQGLLVVTVLLTSWGGALAEKVANLPAPSGYVSDFAGVLSPTTKQSVEDLCIQVDRQAHAQIAIVTIKTLEDDQSVDEFATALEEKWKVGAKGTDRGILMLIVMNPRKWRIDVGYGLEGILNDAKVGDIGRAMIPSLRTGDYNTAIPLGTERIAQVIATDAGVTLSQPQHTYRRVPARAEQQIHLSLLQVIIGGAAVLLLLFVLIKTGNIGLIFFLLGNLMGGGRGGRDNDGGGGFGGGGGDGGGFGGFGGGSSGGGGASGDY